MLQQARITVHPKKKRALRSGEMNRSLGGSGRPGGGGGLGSVQGGSFRYDG